MSLIKQAAANKDVKRIGKELDFENVITNLIDIILR